MKWTVAFTAAALSCVAAEAALHLRDWLRVPMCVLVGDARVYALNPAFPEISSLGFRNREIALPKAPGTYRVVVLGDSVAFGVGVSRAGAFPQVLNRLLSARRANVEVVNCGVPGYSTYNELELFRSLGASLDADLVILQFCLNDVINPRLGWATAGYPSSAVDAIPMAAVPDQDDDRRNVRPMLATRRDAELSRPFVTRSMLFNGVLDVLADLLISPPAQRAPATPKYLAFEDPTSIEVLLSERTPQWKWLMGRFSELRSATTKSDTKLIILLFPLAYQMDRDYSLSPQGRLTASCNEMAIESIDMLPILLSHTKKEMFRLATGEFYDVWHLTTRGHQVVADALVDTIQASLDQARSLAPHPGGKERAAALQDR